MRPPRWGQVRAPFPPVVGLKRAAAGLAASVGAKLAVKWVNLSLHRVDHCQPNRNLLSRLHRQPQTFEPRSTLSVHQAVTPGRAMVVEHGPHTLLPFAALIDQGVAEADARPQVEDVLGWDPGLRQPPRHQELAQVTGVGTVALGALLGAAPGRGFRRLGQVHLGADAIELLDHEAPARRRLQGDLELSVTEAFEEAAHSGSMSRRDALARDLPSRGVDPLDSDLLSVLIKSHYDRQLGPPQAPRLISLRGPAPRLSWGGPYTWARMDGSSCTCHQ